MTHKAGYVNIVGNPNVGKSTLMNALVGEKLSIITSKAQTTRHRILGIVNGDNFQIVFSDTPGIIHQPAYKMHHVMNQFVETAFIDADLILFMVDVSDPAQHHTSTIEKLQHSKVPVFVLINKIDLSDQPRVEQAVAFWNEALPGATVFPLAALPGHNVAHLFQQILGKIPESPYSVEVAVDAYEETEKLIRIQAIIFAARDSQKAILIGKQGSAIKKTGTQARADIEEFVGKKVFLELSVKVNKNWRDDEQMLRRFGYEA